MKQQLHTSSGGAFRTRGLHTTISLVKGIIRFALLFSLSLSLHVTLNTQTITLWVLLFQIMIIFNSHRFNFHIQSVVED